MDLFSLRLELFFFFFFFFFKKHIYEDSSSRPVQSHFKCEWFCGFGCISSTVLLEVASKVKMSDCMILQSLHESFTQLITLCLSVEQKPFIRNAAVATKKKTKQTVRDTSISSININHFHLALVKLLVYVSQLTSIQLLAFSYFSAKCF